MLFRSKACFWSKLFLKKLLKLLIKYYETYKKIFINNNSMTKTIGSRAEVWHGNAKMTSGRLTKEDLHKNKLGRIVSKKKSLKHSKDPNKNPLLKSGLQQKKGSNTFGPNNNNNNNNNKKNNKSLKSKTFSGEINLE